MIGRTRFITAYFHANKAIEYPKHCVTKRIQFLEAITQHLEKNTLSSRGPFVIGERLTYADIVLYQILHDEELVWDGLKQYRRLREFVEAVEGRKNVKAFLESERYLG
jgi:glutathione S-transferase